MKLEERKNNILGAIIKEYVGNAQPVGSQTLVDKYFNVSSATMRNEMVSLEKHGFIMQPHTSAGRIPTEKGYRYFVDSLPKELDLEERLYKRLQEASSSHKDMTAIFKQMAKELSELGDCATLVAFPNGALYYTGLSNIFSQPEFAKSGAVISLTKVIDHIDDVIQKLYTEKKGVKILIGSQNPFGVDCSALVVKHKYGLFVMLGTMRMDYIRNIALLYAAKSLIDIK